MAADTASMTPDQAISVLNETRSYRETLTARAAGIIWLVWGVALGFLVAVDLAFVMAMEAEIVSNNNVVVVVALGLALIGAGLTNMVWRAHALETDPRPRAWITYVIAAALIIGAGVLLPLLDPVYDALGWQTPTRISPFLLLAADGAIAIGIVLRRHVSIAPALVAAGAFVIVEIVLAVIDAPRTLANEFWYGLGVILDVLLIFAATGYWYHLRG